MITRERISPDISEFMRYLAAHEERARPSHTQTQLSQDGGVSVASLREQLEVARALGLVEAQAWAWRDALARFLVHTGDPLSLGYALALNDDHFRKYSQLRNHVEFAYWYEAVETTHPAG